MTTSLGGIPPKKEGRPN